MILCEIFQLDEGKIWNVLCGMFVNNFWEEIQFIQSNNHTARVVDGIFKHATVDAENHRSSLQRLIRISSAKQLNYYWGRSLIVFKIKRNLLLLRTSKYEIEVNFMGEKMNLEVEARATTDKILLLHIQMRFSKQQFSANARIYLNSWISEKNIFSRS